MDEKQFKEHGITLASRTRALAQQMDRIWGRANSTQEMESLVRAAEGSFMEMAQHCSRYADSLRDMGAK